MQINTSGYPCTNDGLQITVNNQPMVVEADTIIVCVGQDPNRDLYESLMANGLSAELVGGAYEAKEFDAKAAIKQASEMAARPVREAQFLPDTIIWSAILSARALATTELLTNLPFQPVFQRFVEITHATLLPRQIIALIASGMEALLISISETYAAAAGANLEIFRVIGLVAHALFRWAHYSQILIVVAWLFTFFLVLYWGATVSRPGCWTSQAGRGLGSMIWKTC